MRAAGSALVFRLHFDDLPFGLHEQSTDHFNLLLQNLNPDLFLGIVENIVILQQIMRLLLQNICVRDTLPGQTRLVIRVGEAVREQFEIFERGRQATVLKVPVDFLSVVLDLGEKLLERITEDFFLVRGRGEELRGRVGRRSRAGLGLDFEELVYAGRYLSGLSLQDLVHLQQNRCLFVLLLG